MNAAVIDRLDHLVLTVADAAKTIDFYVRGLGMKEERFGGGRLALSFGRQKINVHVASEAPILPRAAHPAPGSADICLIAAIPLEDVEAHLKREGFAIELGPVPRTGATGPITSLYLRDPDGNLVEVSTYG
jgi:catechol 2,3-dioxygenase-like lactoylglutathione lyase family enzyme